MTRPPLALAVALLAVLVASGVGQVWAAPSNATTLADKLETTADTIYATASKAAATLKSAKEILANAAINAKIGGLDGHKTGGHGLFKGKHVILFISDQESPLLLVPPGWKEANLPGETRLKANGVEFKRAYTNACMCSPARATLFTGFRTSQSNCRYVLQTSMSPSLFPQVNTPADLPNLSTAAAAAGYDVVYKGKFHLTKPANTETWEWTSQDAGQYGFTRWNYPDAGANTSLDQSGGLPTLNDQRFMENIGPANEGEEGAYQYITEVLAHSKKPVFMVISLVNPHDVLFFPDQFAASGYSPALLEGDVELPLTYGEDLSTKPSSQAQWILLNQINGAAPNNLSQAQEYVNFYANLIKETDAYLNSTLNLLDALGLTDKTVVIKTSDHGEMALSHGGAIQKMFNMYEQSLRVPLIISNPALFPQPLESDALVSHVDFVPTIASLLGVSPAVTAAAGWQGVDYSSIVADVDSPPVQDTIIFTFDDFQFGQPAYPGFPAQHVRAIVEERWKFAEYFDPAGNAPTEYEMYDRLTDPLELDNLAWPTATLTPEQAAQKARLAAKLEYVVAKKLVPRLGVEWPIDLASDDLRVVDVTELSRSEAGGATGTPVGGSPLVQPGATVEVVYTPAEGKPCFAAFNSTAGSGDPCLADVEWSVRAGAGSLFGTAKAVGLPTPAGGVAFTGLASIYEGTAAFRGVRAEGLRFEAVCSATGRRNGTLSIVGTAVTKSLT